MERADEATEAGERLRAQQDKMASHVAEVMDVTDANLDELVSALSSSRQAERLVDGVHLTQSRSPLPEHTAGANKRRSYNDGVFNCRRQCGRS
jgi:hypothetical protein